MRVLKFECPRQPGRFVIHAPIAAFLHLGLDGSGTLCVWALEDERCAQDRTLELAWTGRKMETLFVNGHIGTCLRNAVVWHLFEVPR